MSKKIRAILVEDDSDFAFLIRKMIMAHENLLFSGWARSGDEALPLAESLLPDVALVDLNLTGHALDGVDVARRIRLSTKAKVLLLTAHEEPQIIIHASKRAFASGYIFKSQCQSLADTIEKTAAGTTAQAEMIKELVLTDLTHSERAVLKMILGADANTYSAEKTIANQKTSVIKKLGVRNATELRALFGNW